MLTRCKLPSEDNMPNMEFEKHQTHLKYSARIQKRLWLSLNWQAFSARWNSISNFHANNEYIIINGSTLFYGISKGWRYRMWNYSNICEQITCCSHADKSKDSHRRTVAVADVLLRLCPMQMMTSRLTLWEVRGRGKSWREAQLRRSTKKKIFFELVKTIEGHLVV